MHELNFVDESFDLKLTSEYHLSIQAGLDGFSFCILDILRNKYIVFRHIPLIVGKLQFLSRKIESIFEHEEKLNAAYQSVSISYSTNKATLIPKEYSDSGYFAKIASLTSDISRGEDIRTEVLPGFNYQLVYSFPKDIMALFNRKYTDFQFRHKSITLLATALQQRSEKENTILINFEKKYIRMIALKGMQISLYNSFYFKNESDFLYYTLNICHNLQFDPERDEIRIGGYVADDSAYIRQLKKYISNVQFMKPSAEFNYGNIFEKVQKHQFISLLNSYPCE
ncbi:MAG TPA: DUF3822 family protein [Prolixibacteraceae bacterium]|nr:DUF3822 family protein [Prolixibacteraceae bacterium]